MTTTHSGRRVLIILLLLALVATGVLVVGGGDDAEDTNLSTSSPSTSADAPADDQGASDPDDRANASILLTPPPVVTAGRGGEPLNVPWANAAVRVDGQGVVDAVALEVPASVGLRQVIEGSDGSVAAIGVEAGAVGAQDGPDADEVRFLLLMFDEAGRLELRRDIRVVGEDVQILDATSDAVLLQRAHQGGRSTEIVSHDVVTGEEQTVADLAVWAAKADRVGDLVAVAPGTARADGNCELNILSLVARTTSNVTVAGCTQVQGISVSPDGGRALVAYDVVGPASTELRATIVEVASGSSTAEDIRLADRLPYGDPQVVCGNRCPSGPIAAFAGATWSGLSEALVALIVHPTSGDPNDIDLDTAVRVEAVAA